MRGGGGATAGRRRTSSLPPPPATPHHHPHPVQRSKADTSGTAKAIVQSFVQLGVQPFSEADIVKVRDAPTQLDTMGVPEDAIGGHAFHTYRLISPDGSVAFEFQHNVCGRVIYAEGTVDAALFLADAVAKGTEQKIFDMVDVLKAGAMR